MAREISSCALKSRRDRVGRLGGIEVVASVRDCTSVGRHSTQLAMLVSDRGRHISGTGTGSRTGPDSEAIAPVLGGTALSWPCWSVTEGGTSPVPEPGPGPDPTANRPVPDADSEPNSLFNCK